MAELDSALNKWVDSVPDHCTCARIVIHRCIYPHFFFQYDGIPLGKTKTHSTNQRLATHFIIIFKFLSIVHSSRLLTNLHLFHSLLWLFAQTPQDRVAILLRSSDGEFGSLHYIPMSVESLLLFNLMKYTKTYFWYRWRYLLLVLYYSSVFGEENGLDCRLILIRR